jgi:hypothetical protein
MRRRGRIVLRNWNPLNGSMDIVTSRVATWKTNCLVGSKGTCGVCLVAWPNIEGHAQHM